MYSLNESNIRSNSSIDNPSNRSIEYSVENAHIRPAEFPVLITADDTNPDLPEWTNKHKTLIDELLYRSGAILFRSFNVDNAQKLQDFASSYSDNLLDYIERAATREKLAPNVFSSTAYAKEEAIPLHHEMSYSHNWPSKIYFSSEIVAEEGGFTPIADDRKIIKLIPEEIRDTFMKKKVMYIRNFGLGIDMDWQEAFQTNDKSLVEVELKKSNTNYEWIGKNVLRTKAIRQVVATHPVTRDIVWFNHAHLFHSSNMPKDIRQALTEEFGDDGLPRNAYYGDGSKIDDTIVEKIREIYSANSIQFQWQKGDALLIDNFLITHGRSPFKGQRKVCVAMSDLYSTL